MNGYFLSHQMIYDTIAAINLAALAYLFGWKNGRQSARRGSKLRIARGVELDRLANNMHIERERKCERRWYTLGLWLHDESDDRLRERVVGLMKGTP